MHDGSLKTLREVVEHYNKGGNPNPQLDRKIDRRFAEQLNLSEEDITALIKFMEALDGDSMETPLSTQPLSVPLMLNLTVGCDYFGVN